MRIYKAVFLAAICFCTLSCFAQISPPGADKFTVVNRHLTFGTDGSLHLDEADNAGFAWINNRQFNYGTIEFDVKGNDKLQGSFVGIAYHGLSDSTYECVYFRPFNFLAEDAVRKSHGVQYMASPKYDWPVLRERFPNKYEQAVIPAPNPNGWFHARITVSPKSVEVFVNGVSKAVLKVEPLVNTGGTKIGYWVGNGSPGGWKNLKITDAK
ncbi:hypothetical protein ACFQZI_14310 [Mucilaginibacter lutimaris]|uniref:DUF1080 domain-containing protein n=1 Tax=Mucilaginibacter lutimaris TaxID=931629 RepID=A0ABW2ZIP5_9SPHI